MLYEPLLNQLAAINALSVTGHKPPLNERGKRILKYLWKRSNREEE